MAGRKIKHASSGPACVLTATVVSATWLCWPAPSRAYRPFDGTDASVADLGELETEFQPAGALWEGSQTTLIAPDLVFNFGFKENWEATLEGCLETPVSQAEPSRIADAALLVKGVLRPGSLSGGGDMAGPRYAAFRRAFRWAARKRNSPGSHFWLQHGPL